MKRVTWIPVAASAFLLLIAGPVVAGDLIGFPLFRSTGTTSKPASQVLTPADDIFAEDPFAGPGEGRSCGSELGAIENPF